MMQTTIEAEAIAVVSSTQHEVAALLGRTNLSRYRRGARRMSPAVKLRLAALLAARAARCLELEARLKQAAASEAAAEC